MKSFTLLSALAALGAVSASPTKSLSVGPSKRASTLPQVSASGNGKPSLSSAFDHDQFGKLTSPCSLLGRRQAFLHPGYRLPARR